TRTLVLHVRRRNRNAPRLLLRCLVNLFVRLELTAKLLGTHLRQRRRQRRLPMVHVTNRPYVHVRLRTLKFSFRHRKLLISLLPAPVRQPAAAPNIWTNESSITGSPTGRAHRPRHRASPWSPQPDLNR